LFFTVFWHGHESHEHDSDTEMRPYKEPITAEAREKLIVGATGGTPTATTALELPTLIFDLLQNLR